LSFKGKNSSFQETLFTLLLNY